VNEAYWIAAQTSVVPNAWGDPGTGKTRGVEAFARANKRRCISVSLSQHEPSDIGGFPKVERDGNSVGYVEFLMPKFLYDCKYPSRRTKEEEALGFPEYPKTVLFIDELTTCQPSTQGAALRLMTHAADYLGEDTWVLSAANPPECAANGFPLEPPMVNRLYHHAWDANYDEWANGMMNGFQDVSYPILKDDWKSFIPKSRVFIMAFLSRNKTLAQQLPSRKGDQQNYGPDCAWPSHRSWDNASILLAAANSLGFDSNKDNMSPVCSHLLHGCVGQNCAQRFFDWKNSVSFPSWEETKKLIKTNKFSNSHFPNKSSGDKVMAYLSTMFHDVAQSNNEEDYTIGFILFEKACSFGCKDIAIALKDQIVKPATDFAKIQKKSITTYMSKDLRKTLEDMFNKVYGQ